MRGLSWQVIIESHIFNVPVGITVGIFISRYTGHALQTVIGIGKFWSTATVVGDAYQAAVGLAVGIGLPVGGLSHLPFLDLYPAGIIVLPVDGQDNHGSFLYTAADHTSQGIVVVGIGDGVPVAVSLLL